MSIVVGIDPGLTGAIAFVDHRSAVVVDIPTVPLPGNGLVKRRVHGPALAEIIRRYWSPGEAALVLLEDVATMGGQNNAVQTQGSLMRTRGTIECVLEMLRMEVRPVQSRAWKKFYGLDADKAKSLETARRLYPSLARDALKLAKHHNRAESLLIAHYGARTLT